MGVYIKGMTKKQAEKCFKFAMDGCCVFELPEIVELPPHGDLIDRRYAIATACSGRIRTLPTTEDGENWIRVEEVRDSIKNAPTIIPEEDGMV